MDAPIEQRPFNENAELSLLSSLNRVETPFIRVTIGDYIFGVIGNLIGGQTKYQRPKTIKVGNVHYPNYIQSLNIVKINGQVNKYTLTIVYPITEKDDPNFFEKVFSSVSKSRKIIFSYGDATAPAFAYKEEQALITKITNSFNVMNSSITYNISAVSSANLLTAGYFNFEKTFQKPSDIIKKLLKQNDIYGILDIFVGMRRWDQINMNLIPGNDKPVLLEAKHNISVLDYLNYLVDSMVPENSLPNQGKNADASFYSLIIHDDTSGQFEGAYFEIKQVSKKKDIASAFSLDIGYPSNNIVLSFSTEDNENYAILYDYNQSLTSNQYTYRINNNGEIESIFSPSISSLNPTFKTHTSDKTWWTKITEYPIKAHIQIKGLLRPAILMTHLRLGVYFYGKKHISSGLYVITKQVDDISESGFKTTLDLLRISGDNENL